ncbi:unnamed protein product, partial [Prorocentrum cordatum]
SDMARANLAGHPPPSSSPLPPLRARRLAWGRRRGAGLGGGAFWLLAAAAAPLGAGAVDLSWVSYSEAAELPMSQRWRDEMKDKLARIDTSQLSAKQKMQFKSLMRKLNGSSDPEGGLLQDVSGSVVLIWLLIVAGERAPRRAAGVAARGGLAGRAAGAAAAGALGGSALGGRASSGAAPMPNAWAAGGARPVDDEARQARLRRFG